MRLLLYSVVLFFCIPFVVQAASVRVSSSAITVGVGDEVQIEIVVDTTVALNAFSGVLIVPPSFEVVAVSDGNSIVSVWITPPQFKDGQIVFEGLVPGGYTGRGGRILQMILRAKTSGTAPVSVSSFVALRNDGRGTTEPVEVLGKTFTIAPEGSGRKISLDDTELPETFIPYLVHQEDMFEGKKYLVFSTVDKKSGIDHFEVREVRLLGIFSRASWARSESPYVLMDQYQTSRVEIRAVDKAGNMREVVFPRVHLLRPYEIGILSGILIVLLLWWQVRQRRRVVYP